MSESEAPKPNKSSKSSARKHQTPFSSPIITEVSATVRSVFLQEWWLKRVDDKGLVVEGFASRESLGVRLFSSAAIAKRHCATVLETTDGITITLCGPINMSWTRQNGFPCEVCNQFLLGFPYNWEEYATGKESADIFSGKNGDNSSPLSLNDLPVHKIRDHLMSNFGTSNYDFFTKNIYSDTLRSFTKTKSSMNSSMESNSPVTKEKSHQPRRNPVNVRHRVCTRSMTRRRRDDIDGEFSKRS
ncbi:hypothetical protein UlMin_027944 [Ulmus minor]